jgi:hypothetical protein
MTVCIAAGHRLGPDGHGTRKPCDRGHLTGFSTRLYIRRPYENVSSGRNPRESGLVVNRFLRVQARGRWPCARKT